MRKRGFQEGKLPTLIGKESPCDFAKAQPKFGGNSPCASPSVRPHFSTCRPESTFVT